MLIGRQEDTGLGGRVDLLAVAPDGAVVLIELKRERTPREVLAQAVDYSYCQLAASIHRKLGRTAEAGQVHRLYIAVTKKAGSQLICPRLLTVVIIQGQRPETSLLTSHMTQPLATERRVLKRLVQSLPCKSQAFARSVPFAPR
jgi:hypothetical protein